MSKQNEADPYANTRHDREELREKFEFARAHPSDVKPRLPLPVRVLAIRVETEGDTLPEDPSKEAVENHWKR